MNKVKNQLLLNVFVIIAGAIFALVLIIGNVGRITASVAVVPGSYGEQYAQKNNLKVVELADSEKGYFDERYETFDYTVNGDGITVENYKGVSSDLVIPALIEGKAVTVLGENFVGDLNGVKNLFIPPTVTDIQGDVDESITIHCYEETIVYEKYLAEKEAKEKEAEKAAEDAEKDASQDAENGSSDSEETTLAENQSEEAEESEAEWKFEPLYDSDFVNFLLDDLQFAYNMKGVTAEVTKYYGNDNLVVIPSYINGYPVTDISMDLLGTAKGIVIPETVTSITGTSAKLLYSPLFAIELIFSLVAIVLSLITVNVLLPRYRKDNSEYLLTGSQMVSVILYVLCQLGFAIAAIYYISISPFLALVISLAIIAVFVLFVFSAGIGRQHAKAVSNNIAGKTSRMKAIKELAKGMDESVTDPEVKKQVRRLVEEIRYSDPVSREDLDSIESEIEKAITDVKNAISKGDSPEILRAIDDAKALVLKRNARCKAGK